MKNKALFVTISQLITATKTELGMTEEQLTDPFKHRSRKAADARQILMLLIYAETPESKISRQVIAEMFGYSTPLVQFKAKEKLSNRFQFRKKYEQVESKYNKLKKRGDMARPKKTDNLTKQQQEEAKKLAELIRKAGKAILKENEK